jgi:2-amino-4-hydroxy-6-hydroxymethyldihydropteridine diphosphokinase
VADTDRVSERRVRAYIGLGANIGDAEATLTDAVHALAALPGARLRGVSRLYATVPVGVTDQPEFLNAVVALDVRAGRDHETGALELLGRLKELERGFGRRRRRRWGPRELDLDLLVFGRARLAVERPPEARSIDADTDSARASKLLEVPHPAAATRLFVLAPLADLARGLVPPGWHGRVDTARRRQARIEGETAVRVVGEWDPVGRRWRRRAPRASGATQPRDRVGSSVSTGSPAGPRSTR